MFCKLKKTETMSDEELVELLEIKESKKRWFTAYLIVIAFMIAVFTLGNYQNRKAFWSTATSAFEKELEKGRVYEVYFDQRNNYIFYNSTSWLNPTRVDWDKSEEHVELLESKGVKIISENEKSDYLKLTLRLSFHRAMIDTLKIIIVVLVGFIIYNAVNLYNIKVDMLYPEEDEEEDDYY